jgi:hypothetical protein
MKKPLMFTLTLLGALSACQFATVAPLKTQAPLLSQRVQTHADHAIDGEADMFYLSPRRTWQNHSALAHLSLSARGQVMLASGQRQGVWTSVVQTLPEQSKSLMPAWQMPTPAGVQVEWQIRFSADQRQWGSWLPLLKEYSLTWPQDARYFQYQLVIQSASAQGVALELSDLSLQFGNQAPQPPRLPFARRAHTIPKPEVMSREGWQAVPPANEYAPHTIDGIVVHHTWQPDQANYRQAATIRGIQRFHMTDRKWSDIGYHFLIGPEGVIYQGRPETVVGSHSVPNTGKVGICIIGDYDPGRDPFTDKSYQALLNLITWLTAEYQVSPNEYYGHRNFSTKSCPGDSVYHRLNEIRAEVIRRLTSAGIPIPPPPTRESVAMPAR